MSTNNSTADEQLKSFIERVERLTEEKKAIGQDITEIFSEAKASGFDVKAMKEILKIRSKSPQEVEELEILVDTYKAALKMI